MEADASGPFPASLAGVADRVEFGLRTDYEDEVRAAFSERLAGGFAVTVAAHGASGSSVMAFRFVARMLIELLLRDDISDLSDAEVWDVWAFATAER